MSFLSRIFSRKDDTSSYAFRKNKAKMLHGQVIKYVTENRDGNDDVVGRGGSLCLHGEEFIVDSSGDRLFACEVKDLEAADLMSGDGVVIKGPDLLHGGTVRTIVVHFVYYRK